MVKDVRDRLGLFCNQLARWPSLDAIVRDAGACRELDELLDCDQRRGPGAGARGDAAGRD